MISLNEEYVVNKVFHKFGPPKFAKAAHIKSRTNQMKMMNIKVAHITLQKLKKGKSSGI